MDVVALLIGVAIIGVLLGFISYQSMKLDLFIKSTSFSFNLFIVSIYAKEDA